MEQQREAASFAMWLFLLTEIMFFGGLFTAYLIYRNWYYPAFVAGSTSSASAGERQHARAHHLQLHHGHGCLVRGDGKRKSGLVLLSHHAFLGSAFLGIKSIEYNEKIEKHHIPGIRKGFKSGRSVVDQILATSPKKFAIRSSTATRKPLSSADMAPSRPRSSSPSTSP